MIITINTDASFSNEHKFWTYAFWIKSDKFCFKWSWVFKEKLESSTEAESRAIMVAIWIIQSQKVKFRKLIFNRDNIWAKFWWKKHYQKELQRMILQFKKVWLTKTKKFFEFRHVKAHTSINNKRSYVNNWCDKKCKEEFYNFKNNHL